jgi:dinuclear metal center YbgI/SA1388 family protein
MNGIEFRNIFESLYPQNLAYEWDNVGLQVGTFNKEIDSMLLCLDLTKEVVEEAIKNDVQLIVVHHPLIFSALKSINTDSYQGNIIELLIKNDITLYAAHTNFDISNYGMNNMLADMLGLKDIVSIEELTDNEGIGKVGNVASTPMKEYIEHVKKYSILAMLALLET